MFSSKKSKFKQKLSWHSAKIPTHFHLNPSDITLPKGTKLLDKGHFGQIYKAKYKGKDVAIKTVKFTSNDNSDFMASIEMFVEECEISLQLGRHKHVLQYVGIYFPEKMPKFNNLIEENMSFLDLPCLVSNFMPKGNMLKYLDDSRLKDFTVYKAITFCSQLANGMKYLQHHKINHADLACRNLLLDAELTVKISDFGLSQKGLEYNYGFMIEQNIHHDNDMNNDQNIKMSTIENPHQVQRCFPIWWSAIEVQENKKITNFSDVWSFGVTAWEIFARGLRHSAVKWVKKRT